MTMKRSAAPRIVAAQRKIQVWELRQQHTPQHKIAEIVGVSTQRVSQILAECIAEQDQQVLASKEQYRKFLLSEAEAQAARLHEMLAEIKQGALPDRVLILKTEEQLRKNAEYRAKLTAAEKVTVILANQVNVGGNPLVRAERPRRARGSGSVGAASPPADRPDRARGGRDRPPDARSERLRRSGGGSGG